MYLTSVQSVFSR